MAGITCSYLISGVHTYLINCLGDKSVPNSLRSPPSSLLVCGNVFVVFLLSWCIFVTMSDGMECNKEVQVMV